MKSLNNLVRVGISTLAASALLLGGLVSPASAVTPNLFPSDDGVVTAGAPAGYSNTGAAAGVTYSVVSGHTGANALWIDQTVSTVHSWFANAVPAAPGQYAYTDAYQSSVVSEVGADFFGTSGNYLSYAWLGTVPACPSPNWCTSTFTVTVPTGAAMVDVPHDIYSAGNLTIDDFSLTAGAIAPPPPPPPTTPPISTTAGQTTNGGLETIDATSGLPSYWGNGQWGANDGKLSAVSTAHSGGSAVRAEISSFTNGAVDLYQKIPVAAGKTYKVSVAVASNVAVQVGAQGVDTTGKEINWTTVANVTANNTGTTPANWTVATGSFTAPVGAVYEELFVPLGGVGWVVSDDYTVTPVTAPASFTTGMVTVALDDGWTSQYTNGRPILVANKIPATFYIIGNEIGDTPDYMSATQIKQLVTDGNEIGNHTWDHPDAPVTLNTMTAAQIDAEFTQAQTTITSKIGVAPTTCAYPEGSYNATVLTEAAKYFKGCRSVDTDTTTNGANLPGPLVADPLYKYRLMDVNITSATTVAQVKAAINYAKANRVWVILTYHEVVTKASQRKGGDQYYTLTAAFTTEMAYLRTSGVPAMTLSGATDWTLAQL